MKSHLHYRTNMEGLKIIKAGKLEKSAPPTSSCVKRWNERFFILHGSPAKLTYYENEGVFKAGRSQGKPIDLQGCVEVIEEEPYQDYKHLFSVKTSKTSLNNGRVFVINAKSGEDRKQWVDCIRKAIDVVVEKKGDDEVDSLGRTSTGATQKSKTSSGYGSLQEDCKDPIEKGMAAKLAIKHSDVDKVWDDRFEESQLHKDCRKYMVLTCMACKKDFESRPLKDFLDVPQGNTSSQGAMRSRAYALSGLQVKCPHCRQNIGYLNAIIQMKTKSPVENAWDHVESHPCETSENDAEDSSEGVPLAGAKGQE